MADDREERIRARAHSIWESEGQPHGRHDDHWHRASSEVGEGGGLAEGAATFDASGRSLGSAAQSDLIPEDAGQGSDRSGSLVDTGPALGLAAGGLAGGSGGGALGSLSLGQDVGHGGGDGSGVAGGMSSIGSSEGGAGTGPDAGGTDADVAANVGSDLPGSAVGGSLETGSTAAAPKATRPRR